MYMSVEFYELFLQVMNLLKTYPFKIIGDSAVSIMGGTEEGKDYTLICHHLFISTFLFLFLFNPGKDS